MKKTYKVIISTMSGPNEERYVRTDNIDGYTAELRKELKSVCREWWMRYDQALEGEPRLYIHEITIEEY